MSLLALLVLSSTLAFSPAEMGGVEQNLKNTAKIILTQDIPCGTGVFGQGGVRDDPRCKSRSPRPAAPAQPFPTPPKNDDEEDDLLDVAKDAVKLKYRISVPRGHLLNVYKKPTTGSKVKYTLQNGEKVVGSKPRVQPNGSSWALICKQQACGWTIGKYLIPGQPNRTTNFTRLEGKEIVSDHYIRSPGRISFNSCGSACQSDARCRAFTFYIKTRKCFLKTGVSKWVPNVNAISGMK